MKAVERVCLVITVAQQPRRGPKSIDTALEGEDNIGSDKDYGQEQRFRAY
jgi:hypothetical protein